VSQVTAVLSMLHEGPDFHSGTRTFRQEPVIRWTLDRLNRSGALNEIAILCWEDQLDALEGIAEEADAHILAKGPRCHVPEVESIAAARRWGDGWRGGLHGATEFDQGFYGPWIKEIADRLPSDVLVLVNPAAALIDPCLIDDLVNRAVDRADIEMCFLPAAPGFAAATIRPALLDRLAAVRQHPGKMLSYQPDHPIRDAISMDSAVPVPTPVARTTRRFTMDSDRQISLLLDSCESLNGTLITSEAETILRTVNKTAGPDEMPREVTLELSPRRMSRPIDSPVSYHAIRRRNMLPDEMRKLLTELGRCDDLRLTLGGVGDPLCADNVIEVIEAAKTAGVTAINVETDLLVTDDTLIRRLVEAKPDVISVIVPGLTNKTYADVMGVDGLQRVIANVKTLLLHRQKLEAGVPLIAPVFIKTPANLAEMEAWFDQWLRAVGSAVLRGPSDFARQIPDKSVADMSPPCRKACARLDSRLTILCDGTIVACEQDFHGRSPLGTVETTTIAEVWQTKFAAMRDDHANGAFMKHPLCGGCKEWHRP
jgi:hypothetical protein